MFSLCSPLNTVQYSRSQASVEVVLGGDYCAPACKTHCSVQTCEGIPQRHLSLQTAANTPIYHLSITLHAEGK